MTKNPGQELIWQGALHLGDEPGVYGDAAYSGIAAELPFTLYRSNPTDSAVMKCQMVLETEGLQTYSGYPGHAITIVIFEPDLSPKYKETSIANATFQGSDKDRKEVAVQLPLGAGPFRLAVRLHCDVTVMPGLYDDFIWRRLSLVSEDSYVYGSLGFSV
jgi:hypothetical protein